MPGAKIPAMTKISDAGVHKAESGAKNGSNSHSTAALIDSEINDPVIALDSTRPRRIKNMRDGKTERRLKRKIDIQEAPYFAVTTRTVPATVTSAPRIIRPESVSICRRKILVQRMVSNGLQATTGSTRTIWPTLSAAKKDRIAPELTTAAPNSQRLLSRLNRSAARPPRN